MLRFSLLITLLVLLAVSCQRLLPSRCEPPPVFQEPVQVLDPYFVIFLVDAPHIDSSSLQKFLHTIAKHPRDGSKRGDVGHAWIYLSGISTSGRIVIEGGHTGEFGIACPRYLEGVLAGINSGAANPISYLFAPLNDGYFQRGSGGHRPTFAAKVALTKEQFFQLVHFVCYDYDFKSYALTGNQCTTFLEKVAEKVGIDFDSSVTVPIEKRALFCGRYCRLWTDPQYAYLTFASPDKLEEQLVTLVKEGAAESVLTWYLRFRQGNFSGSVFFDKM